MAFNQGCRGLVPQQELDSRFYRYTFVALSDDLSSFGQGSTFTELPSDSLAEFRIPAPPLTQQRAIADYLDAETARIDALIEKKLKLRQLLKEQLAVHIERVIWDGASGTTPLMYLTPSARQIMYGIVLPGPDVEGGVPIIKGGNVASGKLEPHQLARTTCEIESNYVRSRIAEDDVLYAIRGGIGDVAIASKNIVGANITQDVARVAPRADVDSRWIRYALESVTARADALGRVVGATVKGLNIWDLKRVRVPNRNSDEMRAQANELNEIERYTKEIRQRLDQQTQLLTEHRQALITAAVTGELEVAGAPPAEPRR
jgi:type I restriction enzyme S subunit